MCVLCVCFLPVQVVFLFLLFREGLSQKLTVQISPGNLTLVFVVAVLAAQVTHRDRWRLLLRWWCLSCHIVVTAPVLPLHAHAAMRSGPISSLDVPCHGLRAVKLKNLPAMTQVSYAAVSERARLRRHLIQKDKCASSVHSETHR